jgi:hypothetical protein
MLVIVSGDVFTYHQEHLTETTASGNVHRCCCWLVLQHQPAATSVDSCSYSDMLLMMDENIARNM